MNNIAKTEKLQKENADAVRSLKMIINNLITKANGAGLSPAPFAADIKKLNDQLASLKNLEIQLSQAPTNLYQALQVAVTQKKQISAIIGEVSSIKKSLNNIHPAIPQTSAAAQRRHVSPDKPRVAKPQNSYELPSVPTTPVKLGIDRTNLLFDKYVDVEKKLSQTQFQLASLTQRMLSENGPKKIELYSQILSAKKIQASIQNNLDIIRPQLSETKKSASLDNQLNGQLQILNRLDAGMQEAYAKSLPNAPVSKIRIAPNNLQNRSNDEDGSPKGPGR